MQPPVTTTLACSHSSVKPGDTFRALVTVRMPNAPATVPSVPGITDERGLIADIVLLLDVSGSMAYDSKLTSALQACSNVAKALGPNRHLAIVTFATEVRTLLPLTAMDHLGIACVEQELENVVADGLTNLGGAIEHALDIVSRNVGRRTVVWILTDGNASAGDYHSVDDFVGLVSPRNKPPTATVQPTLSMDLGVFCGLDGAPVPSIRPLVLNTLGFGTDVNPVLLRSLATACGGSYSFIESSDSIVRAVDGVLKAQFSLCAHNAKIRVHNLPGTIEFVKYNGIHQVWKRQERLRVDLDFPFQYGSEHKFLFTLVACPRELDSVPTSVVVVADFEYEPTTIQPTERYNSVGSALVGLGTTTLATSMEAEFTTALTIWRWELFLKESCMKNSREVLRGAETFIQELAHVVDPRLVEIRTHCEALKRRCVTNNDFAHFGTNYLASLGSQMQSPGSGGGVYVADGI